MKSYLDRIKEAHTRARAEQPHLGEGYASLGTFSSPPRKLREASEQKSSSPTPRRLFAKNLFGKGSRKNEVATADLGSIGKSAAGRGLRADLEAASDSTAAGMSARYSSPWALSWAFMGPGMLVCLADTDAGCLITAAQSGALWGYRLISTNIVLIPVLYLAQELTVRLAVATRQGHMACIRERFGPIWAWVTCVLLLISCIGTIMSEMSGIASTCEVWGINRLYGSIGSAISLSLAVILLNYKQVEVIGVVFGMFECVFLLTMFLTKPNPLALLKGLIDFPVQKTSFSELVVANIGAVIMPFMIYFQQSAVVARKIGPGAEMRDERSTTFIGSFLTQMIMIATIVSMAAAFKGKKTNLHSVADIADALGPCFGGGEIGLTVSKVLVSLGMIGGSISGAFVVSLAGAWAVCEAGGWDNRFSMDKSFAKAPLFYGSFLAVVVAGLALLLSGVDIVTMNVYIELMSGLLMPMAVGFLYILASGPQCPDAIRIKGFHKYLVAVLFSVCSIVSLGFGFYAIITGNG